MFITKVKFIKQLNTTLRLSDTKKSHKEEYLISL